MMVVNLLTAAGAFQHHAHRALLRTRHTPNLQPKKILSKYDIFSRSYYSSNRNIILNSVVTNINSEAVDFNDQYRRGLRWWQPHIIRPSIVTTNIDNDDDKNKNTVTFRSEIKNLLVCGDGDLSYSASIASELAMLGIRMTATVLEERDEHRNIYGDSDSNVETILSFPEKKEGLDDSSSHSHNIIPFHNVLFGVDATKLEERFGRKLKFDRIQWNFPHWKGKTNHKYNRALLCDFFGSVSSIISSNMGEVHVALCEGQGGSSSCTLLDYRSSWKAAECAATPPSSSKSSSQSGMMLMDVFPFDSQPNYNLSSHRGADRPFSIGGKPEMHVFVQSRNIDEVDLSKEEHDTNRKCHSSRYRAPERYQQCCHHEIHIVPPSHYLSSRKDEHEKSGAGVGLDISLSKEGQDSIMNTVEQAIESDGVISLGIIAEVQPHRTFFLSNKTSSKLIKDMDDVVSVFDILYRGESKALSKELGDVCRGKLERELERRGVILRENRKGRPVSRPVSYHLLSEVLEWRTRKEDT